MSHGEFIIEIFEERIDHFLATHLSEYSRSFLQKCLKKELILLNGKAVKISEALREGDVVTYNIPEQKQEKPMAENLPLDIIFEDKDMLVINKAPDMIVHPGAGNPDGTIVNALLGHNQEAFESFEDEDDLFRPGIVHRLDKDTSGVLIVAKSPRAKDYLSSQFQKRHTRKIYLTAVHGKMSELEGTVETFIRRSKENRKKMSVHDSEGKEAISHYKVIAENKGISLLMVRIETGRTHQIRVHMAHLGNPVIGDITYGEKKNQLNKICPRQMLHAWKMSIKHPESREQVTFEAPISEDFIHFLKENGIDLKK